MVTKLLTHKGSSRSPAHFVGTVHFHSPLMFSSFLDIVHPFVLSFSQSADECNLHILLMARESETMGGGKLGRKKRINFNPNAYESFTYHVSKISPLLLNYNYL